MVWNSNCMRISAAYAVLTLILLPGCGESHYGMVRGVVTLDGKPMADATVAFVPKEVGVGRAAFGVTNADGVYELSTLKAGDGVLIGDYHVTVTAVDVIESSKTKKLAEEFGSIAGDMPQPKPKESWRVPQRYSETESSGLKFSVAGGRNMADWALHE